VLLPPLYMAAESRNPYFRVGYNSLGAYATINHLHFQAYYLMEAFPIERAPTNRLPPAVYKKRHRQGLTLFHFSAQLEPCLTQKKTLHTLNIPCDPPIPPYHGLYNLYVHPLPHAKRSS